jgi:carboxypeptidase C (cathepsin A)
MPTLAKQIVDANKIAGNNVLNFKGFAVGNPYTDPYSGTPAMIDTYWGHQLIAKPTYDAYVRDCQKAVKPNAKECAQLEVEIMNGVGDLNPYALDYPICTTENLAKKGRAQRLWFLNNLLSTHSSHEERRLMGVTSTDKYEPCADDYATSYLNQVSVKNALHVKNNIRWNSCSYKVSYNSTDSTEVSTAPIYNYLIDGGYKLNILVYSGDDDSVCGTIGTQAWIWDLGYNVSGLPWQTYTVNQQTAGYLTKWKNTNFGFLTVHGAGHEVPTYKPDVAFDLWKRYLAGEFTNV